MSRLGPKRGTYEEGEESTAVVLVAAEMDWLIV
jgi:hypothetical protein